MILVPIFGEETIEDPSITDPVQRQEMFGQHDHVRKYGGDFGDRLAKAGFSYKAYKKENLVTPQDSVRMGINIYTVIYLCRKIEGQF